MNKRLKSKIEKRRRQQICEALDLCLQINGLQESKRSLTGDHPTAFFRFYGHTAEVAVETCVTGWELGMNAGKYLNAYLDSPGQMDKLLKDLKQLKKGLHSGNCGGPKNKTTHPYYEGEQEKNQDGKSKK